MKIEFREQDYLKEDELITLIYSKLDDYKTKIICKKFKKYFVINDLGAYMKNLEYNNYEKVKRGSEDDKLKASVKLYIEHSFTNLDNKVQKRIKRETKAKKIEHDKIWHLPFVNSLIVDLKRILTTDKLFDTYKKQIHFRNGYININDGLFYERTKKDFVTAVIPRDYVKSKQKKRDKIMVIISQIFPNKEDRDCILTILSSALSGESCNDQKLLLLMGAGSSGKSMIMSLVKRAFDCYLFEIQQDVFTIGYAKKDKVLNTFHDMVK